MKASTPETPSPIGLLAASVRRERERAGLSVSDLARRAGVSKSTLSQIEAEVGNPSLETLWALAMALDVPVSRLIGEPRVQVQVVRAGEGAAALSEQGGYAATLLAACPPGVQRDVYRLEVRKGTVKVSRPHGHGTVEHVVLCSGKARLGPVDQAQVLEAGDYIRYSADTPHVFEAIGRDAVAVMLIEYA